MKEREADKMELGIPRDFAAQAKPEILVMLTTGALRVSITVPVDQVEAVCIAARQLFEERKRS